MHKIVTTLVSIIFAAGAAIADDVTMFNGDTELKDQSFDVPVMITGNAEIKRCVFTDSLNLFGGSKIKKSKMDLVTVTGEADIKDSEVKMITATGDLELKHVKVLENLAVVGDAELKDVKVSGNASFVGDVEIEKGDFQNISIVNNKVEFKDVTAKTVTFTKSDTPREQTLYLKGKSEITEKVIFEDGMGIVRLKGDAKVNEVIGGKIAMKDAQKEDWDDQLEDKAEDLWNRAKKLFD